MTRAEARSTSRAARALAVGLGAVVIAGCGRVIAPPPPNSAPVVSRDTLLPGHPLVIGVRAARVLSENQYLTRRFGGDSTWGYQSTDRISVRFRYAARNDSTRVRLDVWGPCDAHSCVRGDAASLLQQLATDEPPPQ